MRDVKKVIFMFGGTIFMILGLIGVLLPIISGIPFFLMGILFYAKGSKKFLKWILNHRIIGKHLISLRKEGLSKKVRDITLGTIWTTHVTSIIVVEAIAIRGFLVVMLSLVTWILFSLKIKNPVI